MFTSDIDSTNNKKHIRNSIFAYIFTTIFLIVFNIIYTHFSFGVTSDYMKYMFLITLIGGIIEITFLLICNHYNYRPRTSFNMWNSGLALLVAGCLVEGIVGISGRYTDWEIAYFTAGAIFLILSIILGTIRLMMIKKYITTTANQI